MNYHQFKQLLGHNLLHGEQRRLPDADRPFISAALIQPDYSKSFYVDISPWDGGAVQLGVTKALGCSGVWIKGVDGSINSRYFPENYATAVSVDLPRSSYAWLYRDVNVRATAQAQAFDTLLNQYPPSPELLPWVDFEYTKYGGVQSNPNFEDLRKWLTEWLRLGNPKPIIYSGKYYMDQFGTMPSDVRGMIAGLAIANYSSLNPPLPFGFTEWMYHQFTSSGDAMLIAPNNVNKLALDLSYGYETVPVPPPIGETIMETWQIIATELNVRTGIGTNYPIITTVKKDDLIWGTLDVASNWIHIVKRNGIELDGWCSGNVLYVKKYSVPPPATGDIAVDMMLKSDGTITGSWTNI